MAPMYSEQEIEDPELLERIERIRPQHIVLTLGGGTQERVGLYLKRNLSYLPAIHCIGAAIAFLSGDQVRIPMWADRSYLGWLYRSLSEPRRYMPRYWKRAEAVVFVDSLPRTLASAAHLGPIW